MNKKGFTLIELLIVVVIIGILAAIAIPKFGESRRQAFVSAMRSDLNQVRLAQEIYYNNPANNYTYASALADIPNLTTTAGVTVVINSGDANGWDASATHASATGWTCTYDSAVGTIDCVDGGGSL
jgi:prepilin-type N-terminal cleavage/methylation domain-containing protein